MSTINITYSSELMSNYMQAETVAPDQKFEAIQTSDGHSILFSIGTDGVFYLTEEIPHSGTGWIRNDLSSALAAGFPNASSTTTRTFGVGQNDANGAFTVLVALTVDGQDHLFVATSYSRDEEDNLTVDWTELPYDGTNGQAPTTLNNVYVMQMAGVALIVVDAVNPVYNSIDRYYIDSEKAVSSHYWNLLGLPVDMDASQNVEICGGRKAGDYVNGIYTLGSVGGQQSIVYQEVYNPFGDGAGAASRLNLPSGVVPKAIASTPSAKTPSTSDATYTDLYVTATNGDLYFFAADNQHDSTTGVRLFNNSIFSDVVALYAYTVANKVVVWGLNRAEEVFYTQCPTSGVSNGANWSYPLPLGSGVEQISPYVNRVNGGNTYFAHIGTDSFKKVFQDPISTTWQKQDILLPVDPNTTSQKFDSYTTSINVVDEYNAPVAGAEVLLGSSFRVPVYVNNHYFVLDTAPITVTTDAMGTITVIQRIENTVGACLTVQSAQGGGVLTINPMNNGVSKVVQIDSAEDLSAATVTDDKGNSPAPLVDPSTSDDDLNSAVASIQSLSGAYTNYAPTDTSVSTQTAQLVAMPPARTMQLSVSDSMDSLGDAIEVAAGDLFEFLGDAVDYVIDIIEDTANKVWNFVCNIGGKLFTFVIDTIEKVVGAIEAIFQMLKTLVKDLIQFMKFLFSWGDIQRTKDVFKNMSMVFLQNALNSMQGFKNNLDDVFENLESKINAWAGLPSESDPASDPSINDISSSQDTSQMNTASGSFLQYHFVNNASNATMTDSGATDPDMGTLESLFSELVDALQTEVGIITGAVQEFYDTVLKDGQFKTMSLGDLIKTTIGILADAMVETAENVMDTVLDIFITVATKVVSVLETPIWIPVLSDILEEFFDTTIPFSWLDVIMLVAAVPSTLLYKIMRGSAPFSEDDGFSSALISATTMEELYAVMGGNQLSFGNTLSLMAVTTGQSMPPIYKQVIFDVGRLITTATSFISAAFFWPLNTPGFKRLELIKIGNICNSLVAAMVNGIVQIFAQPAPAQNEKANALSLLLTYYLVVEKGIFAANMIYCKVKKKPTEVSALVDKVLTLILKGIGVITIGEHVYELLTNHSQSPKQANLALAQAGSQVCSIGTASMNLSADFAPEGGGKNAVLGVGIGLYCVMGVIQFVEFGYAAIEEIVEG